MSRSGNAWAGSAGHARFFESPFPRQDMRPAVKMVVFDFDATLTLTTFMPKGEWTSLAPEKQAKYVEYCFESPWLTGSRLAKLKKMLEELSGLSSADGQDCEKGDRRMLCVLSRNRGGVKLVLSLLQHAGLAHVFSAIFTMPWSDQAQCGAYQIDGQWKAFDPPGQELVDHKADWLNHMATHTKSWLPQLENADRHRWQGFLPLQIEEIALVDDQHANFSSVTGASLFRCCKVGLFDVQYRDVGFVSNMGGIGARSDADYQNLLRFVREPWQFAQLQCTERPFAGRVARHPVRLVVFEFDKTLTLTTFSPDDPIFAPGGVCRSELIRYNFETPFVRGCRRTEKLAELFQEITCAGNGNRRVLAVMTRNTQSVVGIYNLLQLAGLADYFSAIWKLPWCSFGPNGLYREDGEWKSFDPPLQAVHDHYADVLKHVCQDVEAWFPQFRIDSQALAHLNLAEIAMVDSSATSFQSNSGDAHEPVRILRFCKVARYDGNYRACGHVPRMGGLGARSDSDYATLKRFVEYPWEFQRDDFSDNNKPGVRLGQHGHGHGCTRKGASASYYEMFVQLVRLKLKLSALGQPHVCTKMAVSAAFCYNMFMQILRLWQKRSASRQRRVCNNGHGNFAFYSQLLIQIAVLRHKRSESSQYPQGILARTYESLGQHYWLERLSLHALLVKKTRWLPGGCIGLMRHCLLAMLLQPSSWMVMRLQQMFSLAPSAEEMD